MRRMGAWRYVSGLAMLIAAVAACEADLEQVCVGGDGTCDQHQLATSSGGECFEGCDTMTPSNRTGEFPCEVEVIMDNCRRCHTEVGTPVVESPFPLDTYEQSQALYFDHAIWFYMPGTLESDFMPLDPPKLTDDEKKELAEDWACRCAPPREPGETCD
jgi:hypothetical protein